MHIAMNLLLQSLLSALTAPVSYRTEIQNYSHINVASVAMKDSFVNESAVVESGEILKM